MAEPKFTPGPWNTDRFGCIKGGEFVRFARGKAQSQVASATLAGNIDTDERDANARLIASAPEMYAALERITSELPTRRDWLDPVTEQMAKAALAKARGEAQ